MKRFMLFLVDGFLNFVHFPIFAESFEEFIERIDIKRKVVFRVEYLFMSNHDFFVNDNFTQSSINPFSGNIIVALELVNHSEKRKIHYSCDIVRVFGGVMRFEEMRIGPKRIKSSLERKKRNLLKKLKTKFPEIVVEILV